MQPVRVWTVSVDRPALERDELRAGLCAEERARADALRWPADRLSFIVRRGALRRVLATELGCEPCAVVLAQERYGKPYVASPHVSPGRITFSASSCASVAAIAVSWDVDVGIDIEDGRAIGYVPETVSVILNASERREFDMISVNAQADVLLSIWTRKEAVLKAQGTGLLRSPREITVLRRAEDREVIFADVVDGCAVCEMHRPPNIHLSVAVDGISGDLGFPLIEVSNLDRVDVSAAVGHRSSGLTVAQG